MPEEITVRPLLAGVTKANPKNGDEIKHDRPGVEWSEEVASGGFGHNSVGWVPGRRFIRAKAHY